MQLDECPYLVKRCLHGQHCMHNGRSETSSSSVGVEDELDPYLRHMGKILIRGLQTLHLISDS